MIHELAIQDFVLISKTNLDFQSGLSIFSGETGAGKSIILDALGFIFGNRSDNSFIRHGSDKSTLVCKLEATPEVINLAQEHGIEITDNTLLIKRILYKDGASKAFINDCPSSVGFLKRICDHMIEFHGQFDRLMESSLHLKVVDQFSGVHQLKSEFKETYLIWKNLSQELTNTILSHEKFLKDQEYFSHLHEELKQFSPQESEEDTLLEEKTLLQQGEKIFKTIDLTSQAIGSRNESVDKIRRAHKSISKLEEDIPLFIDVSILIGEALDKLALAEDMLEEKSLKLDLNPKRLEEIESRLLDLRSLSRKHHCIPNALPQIFQELCEKLELIQNIDNAVLHLKKQIETTQNQMLKQAKNLSDERKKHSKILEKMITDELPELKLEKGKFSIHFKEKVLSEINQDGFDDVEFLVDLNGVGQYSPLSKTASGGELARLMLALKVVLAKMQTSPVIIFDEIDSGMGGSTAAAVATKLKNLSKSSQVIAVTHSPQIAAIADHHYFVEKKGDPISSHLIILEDENRVTEIARMLSGDHITDEAKSAARKLMQGS